MRSALTVRACLLVGALVAGACGSGGPGGAGGPHSALLVTLDTTSQPALGAYGQPLGLTPHLDALAAEGIVYEQARTVAPLTLPAHASMLTGLYPLRHGVRDNGLVPLPGAAETVAERARDAGFQTAAFVSAVVLSADFGLGQGFERYDVPRVPADRRRDPTAHMLERSAERATEAAREWLAARDPGRPFFLWVHYFDPHEPYEPPEAYRERAEGHPYLGEVAWMDHWVGQLVDAVEAEVGLDRTLVLVVGDHGESLGDHGERTHSTLCYEMPLRVPFVIRYPDGWGAGTRSQEIVSVVDVAPTLLEALGLRVPDGLDGVSLFRRAVPAGRGAYFETYTGYLNYGWAPLTGWVDARGKYLHGTRPEFYDLARDPGELRNLVDQVDVAPYRAALERLGQLPALAPDASGAIGPDLRGQIQALGYAGAGSADVEWPGPTADTGLPDARERMDELEAFYAAVLAHNRGRHALAIERLQALVDANPRHVAGLQILATYLYQGDRAAEAIEVLDRIPAAGRERAGVQDVYGHCREALGEPEAALRHFERALALQPDDPHQQADVERLRGEAGS